MHHGADHSLRGLTDCRVIVCDAKVGFDDNAEFRQKQIHELRDTSHEDAAEVEAQKFDLNYIKQIAGEGIARFALALPHRIDVTDSPQKGV